MQFNETTQSLIGFGFKSCHLQGGEDDGYAGDGDDAGGGVVLCSC